MLRQERRAIIKYFHNAKPGRVLDFPAGSGWLSKELPVTEGWEYHGADLYTNPDIPDFTQADLNAALPFPDSSFDYVGCFEGMEHVENYHHALREFYRVLKPGGTLLVSTPNPLNVKSRIRYLLTGTFYGFPHIVRMPKPGEHLHISPINISFFMAFAEKYGFSPGKLHDMDPDKKMFRFLPYALLLKAYIAVKTASKDKKTRSHLRNLASLNVLLNDVFLVSFKKPSPPVPLP